MGDIHSVPQPVLQTPNLCLRPLELGDAPAVHRLASNRRIAEGTIGVPHPYPDGTAQTWIRTQLEAFGRGQQATFAISLRDPDEVIGAISVLNISPEHACAVVGYWVGVPYWGMGFCTESLSALIPFARDRYGLSRLTASCFVRNPASARVLEKCGFSQEGYFPKQALHMGRFEDMLWFGRNEPSRV